MCLPKFVDQKLLWNIKCPNMLPTLMMACLIVLIMVTESYGPHWNEIIYHVMIFCFNKDDDIAELMEGLNIGSMVGSSIQDWIIEIIKTEWDYFCKDGAQRKILGYKFALDTGDSRPVWCNKPAYGPYKSNIIFDQVQQLLSNWYIKRCHGPWWSINILAEKLNQ